MTEEARRLSWIAGGAAIAFSVAIWLLAQSQIDLEPPDVVPTPLLSAILLGVPGLLGWIGAATGRRTVLVAAGILCLFQSAIAFSGVTLIYLLPAVIFLRAATDGPYASTRAPIRLRRVVAAAVLSVPIALIVILNIGFLGVVLIALVAGLAASRRSDGGRPAVGGRDAGRGSAVVVLVIGAWAATLALTETTCWIATARAEGGLAWERIPPTDTLTLGFGVVASSCASGTATPTGVVIASVLLVIALAAAGIPFRRMSARRESPDGSPNGVG